MSRIVPAVALVFCVAVAGCSSSYGNFIKPEYNQPWLNESLAAEFQELIMSKSPPAWTQVTIKHESDDLFGMGVTANLRQSGYAVAEYHPDQLSQGGIPLLYKIDHFGADMYLISVVLNDNTFSRVYSVNQATLLPQGRWAKLEISHEQE